MRAPKHGKSAADAVEELVVDLIVELVYSMAELMVPSMTECAADWIVYVLILSSSYLFYCLLRRYRPKQNLNAPIWRLPTELVLYIAKMLPPTSAAAFALTSRPILNIVGRDSLNLKRKDRLTLLTLLQPDMPKHVLCHQCGVFHGKYSSYQQCHREVALTATHGTSSLPFLWAQQIMNRHCYGQNHKVPAKICYSSHLNKYSRFSRQRTFEFRISGDDLIIRQGIAVVYDRNDKLVKKREVLGYPYIICPHLWWGRVFNARRLSNKRGVSLKCPVCQTEIRYMLQQGDDQQAYFYFTTWHLLGPCCHPSESQWRKVTVKHAQPQYPLDFTRSAAPLRLHFNRSPPLPLPSFSDYFWREVTLW